MGQPFRLSQVTLVPCSHDTSAHSLPARSTRVTLASDSFDGGSEKGPCDHIRAAESRIAFGLNRAGSVLSMIFGLNREAAAAVSGSGCRCDDVDGPALAGKSFRSLLIGRGLLSMELSTGRAFSVSFLRLLAAPRSIAVVNDVVYRGMEVTLE